MGCESPYSSSTVLREYGSVNPFTLISGLLGSALRCTFAQAGPRRTPPVHYRRPVTAWSASHRTRTHRHDGGVATRLRGGLGQLESEGLVAIVPNKGPIVRELTRDEARDLYSIRAVLEGLAARLFVENASESGVGRLERELRSTEQAYADGDSEQILAAKNRFYEILLEG